VLGLPSGRVLAKQAQGSGFNLQNHNKKYFNDAKKIIN
jgi:hypothetical protein